MPATNGGVAPDPKDDEKQKENGLGQRLRWLRERRSEMIMHVAEKMGVGRTTLSAYEHGVSDPPLPTLQALARYYYVTIDWLVSGEGVPAGGPQTSQEAEIMMLFRRCEPPDQHDLMTRAERFARAADAKRTWELRPWLMLDNGAATPAPGPGKRPAARARKRRII